MEMTDGKFDIELFKQRLYEARERAGFSTNAALAAASGASSASIGNYMNGKRTPRGLLDLVPIAKALGVSLDYLCGLSDDPKPSERFALETYYDVGRILDKLSLCFMYGGVSVNGDDVVLTMKDAKLASFVKREHTVVNLEGTVSVLRILDLIGDIEDEMRAEVLPQDSPLKMSERMGV